MPGAPHINHYGSRGQGIVLVLHSLRELGGVRSKQDVLSFIQDADLYEITRHDLPPYPGQNEARYHTLLAWARKDALIAEWLIDTSERDEWQLSRAGRDFLERTVGRYRGGDLKVYMCYLWTHKFKKLIDPSYQPSADDRVRPEEIFTQFDFDE